MHRSEFLKIVKQSFPELTSLINAEQGLLHFEVEVLYRHAQRAMYDGDRSVFSKCATIAKTAYSEGNVSLKDAIDVSFVEMLEFKATKNSSYEWAWESMPDVLKKLYTDFHGSNKM